MTYSVRSATVRFGPVLALDDVTVEVPGGSVVAVVGGDGAGKSTLLRALAGDELTAHRAELLDRASLTAAAGRPAAQLSGGMRRKLGFVMAIVHRPALLILDEPTTGIDPVSRIDLWRLASEAAASGAAVLMSTTYLDEAERAAHLVVLDSGRVLVQGSYDQVRERFAGVVTQTDQAVRAEWAWRRGRVLHEYWPGSDPPAGTTTVAPDLEDIVVALSLARYHAVPS